MRYSDSKCFVFKNNLKKIAKKFFRKISKKNKKINIPFIYFFRSLKNYNLNPLCSKIKVYLSLNRFQPKAGLNITLITSVNMMINLEKNERENRIKSILYIAILFDDMETVQKLLHPKGEFLGMSKGRFMHYLMDSKEFKNLGNSNEDDDEIIQESEYPFRHDETISLDKYPGERCFVLSKKRINDGESTVYIFKVHEHQKNQIGEIVESNDYANVRRLKNDLFLSSKYDQLCFN